MLDKSFQCESVDWSYKIDEVRELRSLLPIAYCLLLSAQFSLLTAHCSLFLDSHLLPVCRVPHFRWQRPQVDEAFGQALVELVAGVVSGQVEAVERERRTAAGSQAGPFMQLHAHFAGDTELGLLDKGIQREAQRGEPQAVVDQFGIFLLDARFEMHHAAFQTE